MTYYKSQDGKTISRGYGATFDAPPTQGGSWTAISPQERPDLYPQTTPANAGTPELTLPSMSATGNTPITTPAPTLPATNDTGSLVGFKDNMARVMTLAEQKRNDLLKQFMIPFKGTMQASDFTSLFSDFTAQSDQSNKMILERLIPKPDTQLITETDASGRITAITIDKNTGKVVNKEDLGVIGKPTVDKTIKGFAFSNDDRGRLFATGLNDKDVMNIQNDIIQNGADAVLEGLTDEKQRKVVENILKGVTPTQEQKQEEEGKPFLTKEYIEKYYGESQLKEDAKEAGFAGFWSSWKTEKENYLKYLLEQVELKRQAGMTDKEIFKDM